MTKFVTHRLEDIADLCLGKMLDAQKNKGVERPYLANVNVRWGEFDLVDLRMMRFEDRELDRFGLRAGDIVMCEGGEPGRCAIWKDEVPEITIQKALHRIRVRVGVDQRFLYYAFLHKGKTGGFQHLFTGSTIKHLPAEKLRLLEVGLPPLGVQVEVAQRLSALDDLIDNNRRRIKLLEESVRLLFDEWFVRLRFPGASTSLSPGELPAGWSREPFGRLTSKIGSGATPRGGEGSYVEEGIPLIRSQNVYDYEFVDEGLAFIDEDQAARLDGVTVAAHDVLLNITGASVGRCCMVPSRLVPARVNQHVMIIRAAANMDPHYLLCSINSDARKRQLLSYAQTGSTREALTKDLMSSFEVLVPDTATLTAFGQIARDVFDQREVLSAQNVKLRTARDLLLPRLMSGELTV